MITARIHSREGETQFSNIERFPCTIGNTRDVSLVLPDLQATDWLRIELDTASGQLRLVTPDDAPVQFLSGERRKRTVEDGDVVLLGPYTICFFNDRQTTVEPLGMITTLGSGQPHRQQLLQLLMDDFQTVLDKKGASAGEQSSVHVFETYLEEARERYPAVRRDFDSLRQELVATMFGLGPLAEFLSDDTVTAILVNGTDEILVERGNTVERTGRRFQSVRQLAVTIERIVAPLGRRIDESSPMVDARLSDGSRVNVIVPPLAVNGPFITIRKFPQSSYTLADLVANGTLSQSMAEFLRFSIRNHANIVVAGGTGSGKTTLLGALLSLVPENERMVVIEDSLEVRINRSSVCRLETRPANIEGRGRISIRDLVINALRMHANRIVVGECRGGEALDMLQAMNTGHEGSLTTIHANSPRDALLRLETMVMMAGYELPSVAIREQLASAINLVVQMSRLVDGSRRMVNISEVTGRDGNVVTLQDIFMFERTGRARDGTVEGHFQASGNVPSIVEASRLRGDQSIDLGVFERRENVTAERGRGGL